MPRIRYIALLSAAPPALAAYYRESFGLQQLEGSPAGDVALTDGSVKLAIFQLRDALGEARMEPGLHRLGIAIDNVEEVKARFRRQNPRGVLVPELPGPH